MNAPSPITLTRARETSAPVSAGWLPSPDPVEWLREIAHARRHGCDLALYPVARSTADPRAPGVFLVPRGKGSPVLGPRVIPLIQVLPGVHIPQGAGLSAGLLPNEKSFFFAYPLHLLHPSLGLIGFEPRNELPPARLLETHERPNASWNWAVAAPAPHPAFSGLRVEIAMEDAEQLIATGAGDIGTKANERPSFSGRLANTGRDIIEGTLRTLGRLLNKLPGSAVPPASSGTTVSRVLGLAIVLVVIAGVIGLLWAMMGHGASLPNFFPGILVAVLLFHLLRGVFGGAAVPGGTVPASPANRGPHSAPGGKNRLLKWISENWERIQAKRDREIDRLLKLMETNPEEGLLYALPLAASEAGRGKAPATWELGRNNAILQRGGSGPRDVWNLGDDTRLRLEKHYREAARRATGENRHDRAAYILGKLLGDWNGAAQALAKAGRHHDAVAIYLQKLNNKRAAATCLEEAGLLAQAADLLIEMKLFEKAGELHARLGNDEEARRLWLLAAETAADSFEKARIHHQLLKDPETALAILEKLWLAGNPAALQRMFELLKSEDHRAEALELVRRMFRDSPLSLNLEELTKSGLREMERWNGDPDFRSAVESEVYPRMGKALVDGISKPGPLLALLPRFAPDDRLLARDAKRWSVPRTRIESPARKRGGGSTRPTTVIRIPMEAAWQSLAEVRGGVSIAGHANGILAVAQLRDGQCHTSPLMTRDKMEPNAIVRHLGVISERSHGRLFHFPSHGTLHYRSLDRARTPADEKMGDLRNILAAGPHDRRDEYMLLEHTSTNSLCVHVYSEASVLKQSVPLDYVPPVVTELDWYCAGRNGHLCFTAEGFFTWRHPNGEFSTSAMDEAPRGLLLSPPHLPPVALLPRKQHVLVVFPGKPGGSLETACLSPLEDAVACFTRDGQIVVAAEGEGMVFAPGNYVDPVETLALPTDAGKPIAACALGPDGFVFLTSSGNLLVFS